MNGLRGHKRNTWSSSEGGNIQRPNRDFLFEMRPKSNVEWVSKQYDWRLRAAEPYGRNQNGKVLSDGLACRKLGHHSDPSVPL